MVQPSVLISLELEASELEASELEASEEASASLDEAASLLDAISELLASSLEEEASSEELSAWLEAADSELIAASLEGVVSLEVDPSEELSAWLDAASELVATSLDEVAPLLTASLDEAAMLESEEDSEIWAEEKLASLLLERPKFEPSPPQAASALASKATPNSLIFFITPLSHFHLFNYWQGRRDSHACHRLSGPPAPVNDRHAE
jgi:hypothetical protein